MKGTKTKAITVKVSEEEYKNINDRALANNMALASYIRERIFFDIPQIEHNSFEFKMLKSVSYCVGILGYLSKKQLSENDKIEAEKEAGRVMGINGLNESQLKPKTD